MDIWQIISHFDAALPQMVASHAQLTYLFLFLIVYLQIAVLPLFFLPGNPFLFVCGAVCAASQLNLGLLIIVLLLATLLANGSAYWFGSTLGQTFFIQYLKWPNQQLLDKIQDFYQKHGEKGFLFSLFLPVVRTFAPFWAGVINMPLFSFTRASSLGAVIWVAICVLAGYFFGNIPLVKMHLGLITLLGLSLVIVAFLLKKIWLKFVK